MLGFGAIADTPIAGVPGEGDLASVVFTDYPFYSEQAPDRVDLVPGYNIDSEPLYPDSLGYSLGDISLGIAPKQRDPLIIIRNVTEFLTFTQSVGPTHQYNRSINDTLNFTQSAIGGRNKYVSVSEMLVFTVDLPGRVYTPTVSDTLTFTETILVQRVHNKSVSDVLIFNQSAARSITFNRNPTDTLVFAEATSEQKIATRSVNDTLLFIDFVKRVHDRSVHDTLSFTEQFIPGRLRHVYVTDRLRFTESATAPRVIVRYVTDKLEFRQARIIIPTGAIEVEVPFAQYTLVRACDSYILLTDYVILESPSSVVILPTPQFDDTDAPLLKVDVKRTMGNQVYSFIKRNLLHTVHYDFVVGRKKSLEVQKFVNDNAGKFVWLKNWKGEVWYGNIVTNPLVTTLRSRYDNERERATVTIEFTGVKL